VTLLVTDDDGATGSQTQQVTVSAQPPPSGTVSVSDLSGTTGLRNGGWTAVVTIRVVDNNGGLVAGATVGGTWSNGTATSCTTSSAGTCAVSLNVNKKSAAVTWTVAGVTHATLAYNATANLESAITLTRP
jgi:hypothetical protein